MIELLTGELLKKKDLAPQEMQAAMEEIMTGSAETSAIVSFLDALGLKKETPEELVAAARVMRKYALKINSKHKIILDTCGTGGDNSGTFNISTAVSFVTAGAGIAVVGDDASGDDETDRGVFRRWSSGCRRGAETVAESGKLSGVRRGNTPVG